LFAVMGAVAAATQRVGIGSLVARATLRPPATLAHAFDTVARIAGPARVSATIGAGDAESREENESFGLPFGTIDERIAALRAAVGAARDRGYAVWIGGTNSSVRQIASDDGDGWNRWGGTVEQFRAQAATVVASATRAPFTASWGGLVVLGEDDVAAAGKASRLGVGAGVIVGGPDTVSAALQGYADAGADWLVVGPVDSSDPENARLLGEAVRPLLHD
jgi:alkanesulfonate monooxygenase SsuD/methylene tetrahydromethanopterin reductase-like flavin-dependent oxidoreductase (luciferase family)